MGRPKGSGKKDEFADLDSEFKDKIAGLDEGGIRNIIATVALNEVHNQVNKTQDADLESKRMEYTTAGQQYKEASKMNKLRIKFAKRVLEDKGKSTSASLGA